MPPGSPDFVPRRREAASDNPDYRACGVSAREFFGFFSAAHEDLPPRNSESGREEVIGQWSLVISKEEEKSSFFLPLAALAPWRVENPWRKTRAGMPVLRFLLFTNDQ